uniref:F-actin-capping protein subunit beta n=1 Tax=Angiostrongylus cantonensis TaxID=6313 RepID=A0A0K0D4Z5_ANGCA
MWLRLLLEDFHFILNVVECLSSNSPWSPEIAGLQCSHLNITELFPDKSGCWDSIHVIEINERSSRQVHYKLTSTVMLWLQTNKPGSGMMNLGGSLTRQAEQDAPVNEQNTHLVNIGRMIEDQESKMRSTINEIYFGKTKKVIGDLRSVDTFQEKEKQEEIVREIRTVVAGRNSAA